MMADVPLGAFLSGGIDSSTVVALMQSMSSQPVRTFTIGFHQAGYNEAEHARQSRSISAPTTPNCTSPSARRWTSFRRCREMYCEPFSDSFADPDLSWCRSWRAQKVTVSLSGDGGDELFSGYTRYALAERSGASSRWCRALASRRSWPRDPAVTGVVRPASPVRCCR